MKNIAEVLFSNINIKLIQNNSKTQIWTKFCKLSFPTPTLNGSTCFESFLTKYISEENAKNLFKIISSHRPCYNWNFNFF